MLQVNYESLIEIKGCERSVVVVDRMVVEFTTTYAISAYHHYSCEFESCSWRGVLDTTLCNKVCQWLATVVQFPPPIKLTATI